MAERYQLAVVGMGSAGIVAAEFAAGLGVRVVAIERDRIGGDCLWTGCVPSKALLASAKAAHTMRNADRYGIAPVEPEIDTARVLERVRSIQDGIARTDDNPERFAELGVDVLFGAARLTGPGTLEVEGHGTVHAKHVLICTGSRPAVPPIPGLEGAGYLTSETLWHAERLPSSLLVLGGGPIGIELAQACRRLGCEVTILELGPRILPRDEPELVDRLEALLRAEGIRIETGTPVDRAGRDGARKLLHSGDRTFAADEIIVASGRAPNVEGFELVETGPRGIVVDDAYRTSVKGVFAAGDVAGRFVFTHSAGFEAVRAVRNALFPGRSAGAFVVPWCTFSDPELAHVGLTSEQVPDAEVHVLPLDRNDRARAESAGEGAIVLVCRKDVVVGAHVLAPGAGELMGELVAAVDAGTKLKDLAELVHVYPTISLGIQQLAAEAAYADARRFSFLVR